MPDSSLHTNYLFLGTPNTVAVHSTLIPSFTALIALTVISLDHCFLWELLFVCSTSGADNNRCFDPLRLCGGQVVDLYGMKTTVLVTFSISEDANTIEEYTYRAVQLPKDTKQQAFRWFTCLKSVISSNTLVYVSADNWSVRCR